MAIITGTPKYQTCMKHSGMQQGCSKENFGASWNLCDCECWEIEILIIIAHF